MKKITTIGSALVDVFIKSNNFKLLSSDEVSLSSQAEGGKLMVDSFDLRTGGGGSNTAVGFSRMGFEVTCISETGKDNLSELVLSDLEKEGVDTSNIVRERKEETGGSVLLICSGGDRMALVHRGAASMLDPHDVPEEVLVDSDWIHLSSLSGRADTINHIFELVKQHNLQLSWNPGSAALDLLEKEVIKAVDVPAKIMILNKEEWSMVESVQSQLKQSIPMIVVTDSVRGGVIFQNGEQRLEYQAQKVETVDSTGAGDAFITGFVSAQLEGKSLEESAEMGKNNAASVAKQIGAKAGLLRQPKAS